MRNILVTTDVDQPAVAAIITASQLADAAGASLHVMSAVTSVDSHRGHGAAAAETRATLSSILTNSGARADNSRIHVVSGDPAFAIGSLADRLRADVIVLGPHREGRSDIRALGGTALAVVTNAASPCLVVSTSLRLPLRRVLVPIDLSDTARGALLVGLSWASALRAATQENAEQSDVMLTALHVRPPSPDASSPPTEHAIERELQDIRKESGTWAGVSIHGITWMNADVTRAIVDFAAENASDLVVMGTRGLGLDPVGRLGSITASTMKALSVPTLLVPPSVWRTFAPRGLEADAPSR